MGDGSYANLKAFESTNFSGTEILNFSWRPRVVRIINDGTADLKWKLNLNESYATLHSGETIEVGAVVSTLHIFSTGTKYRIWGLG